MKKRIFALLMAMVLVFGMSTTVLAANSPVGDNTPPEVQELEVTWSQTEAWTVEFKHVMTGVDYEEYYAWILKDGKYVDNMWVNEWEDDKVSVDISDFVGHYGAGKYQVEIDCERWYPEQETWITIYNGVSEARTYTKPATQLATPANFVYNAETETVSFSQVEGAVAYDVYNFLTVAGNDSGSYRMIRIEDDNTSDGKVEYVFEGLKEELESMQKYFKEEGIDVTYTLGVCAVSADIDKVAYSEFAKQVIMENKLSKEEVKDAFNAALENTDEPEEAVYVLASVSNDTIVEMLKTDADFVAKVEKLDAAIAEDLGEAYKGATSKTDVVDATKVKVVGVAMNAVGGPVESVELSFAKPEKDVTVPEGYKKGVPLDISLLVDGDALEVLAVPVTITMPIPAGVDTKDLVILHYHGDATEPVVIVPTVNADGTMTFIVDGFSTFVVTNQVVETTAPKTGDSSATVAICSLLLLAAGVVLMKRNAFAK